MYISIEQALFIYDELVLAKYGENGFGGDTAEVYAYKLMPNVPSYNMHLTDDETLMVEKKAAEELYSICEIFASKHKVNIEIDDIDAKLWLNRVRAEIERFNYRIHIKVIRQNTHTNESKRETITSE